MERVSIQRAFGRFFPSLDYTWTQGRHLLGSSRQSDGGDWIDTFESNRALTRHRVHAQLRYNWRRHRVAAHYDWVRARDNSDGPFSFAERPDDLAAEWARSAGVPPHSISAVGSFSLPLGIAINVTETWNGTAPYNVTSRVDGLKNGLFVSRGGRPRNSGNAPAYNSLSLYGYRQIPVRLPRKTTPVVRVNLGVQVDNLLSNTNYRQFGSVADSATFGRPLSASPGRSLKVFLSVD